MKRIILGYTLLCSLAGIAQEQLRTIYCNENQNVVLIMPANIEQAVSGSENFVFSYDKRASDSLGLLQGKPGLESNLLIRTGDGGIYSYLLKYQDTLSRFNYFITTKERINPHKEESLEPKKDHEKLVSKSAMAHKEKYFQKFSKYFLKTSNKRLKIERKHGLKLEVKSIKHYQDHVYVVYSIENNSKIDFEINNLQLYKEQGKKSRRSSYQKIAIDPVNTYRFQEKIHKGERLEFVITYPKFTIGQNEKLKIEITEKKGNRYLSITIKLI